MQYLVGRVQFVSIFNTEVGLFEEEKSASEHARARMRENI